MTRLVEERERLESRLVELNAEREKVTFALSVLRRIQGQAVQPDARARPASTRGSVGATTTFILKALAELGGPANVDVVIGTMSDLGWESTVSNRVETVRASLSRLVRDGMAQRVGHGLYAATDDPASTAAGEEPVESPDDASQAEDSAAYPGGQTR